MPELRGVVKLNASLEEKPFHFEMTLNLHKSGKDNAECPHIPVARLSKLGN